MANIMEVLTEDSRQYQFYPVSSGSIHFKVRAPNDAHIALTMGPENTNPMVQVVIGGGKNTKSMIRRNSQQPDKANVPTEGILNAKEFRGFWVRWDSGIISAGREGDEIPFISWADPEPFSIAFVGVLTAWGATGTWKIEDEAEFDTPDKLEYKFRPAVSDSLEFEYRGPHNCHVCLASSPAYVDPIYEIILGGWENTQSVIRHNRKKPDKVTVSTREILNPNGFKKFRIEWRGGRLTVREPVSRQVIMEWLDPTPHTITHFGIRSCYGARGHWRIKHFSRSRVMELQTEDDLHYQFYPVFSGSLQFKVRAPKDAHIALTIGPQESDPMVEVFIGGWSNTTSVIRRNRQKPDKATVRTQGILNAGEFHGFSVGWDAGIISATREGEAIPFMSWADPEPFPIAFVGVCTGWGATGTWKIEDGPEFDTPDKLEYQFRPASGTLEFEHRGPHNCHVCLTSSLAYVDPIYEIILGGWENTLSVIRHNRKKPDKVTVTTREILNPNGFKKFRIEWRGGRLIVRDGASRQVIMEWLDPGPHPITHFGVRTCYGARGYWRIKQQPR